LLDQPIHSRHVFSYFGDRTIALDKIERTGDDRQRRAQPWAALAVNSRCTTDTPVYVQGNADAIEDAIRNLVENAVTHSPLGEEVTVEVLADGRVNVGDSGPGVPIDIQERIFERFWRGTSVDTAGVGLGLAIVKKIMEAHRGSAAVRNNADRGAIFTLTFAQPSKL